jgi:hypothetical protein
MSTRTKLFSGTSGGLALLDEHGFAYQVEAILDQPFPKGTPTGRAFYASRV